MPSETPLEILIKLSRHYGGDPEFALAAGGNTSMKDGDRIFVKASGKGLANIDASGFVELDVPALTQLLDVEFGENPTEREERFKHAILKTRVDPEKGLRPSVECVLHAILPRRFVVHSHSTLTNMVTCAKNGEKLARELFGEAVLWLPYVDPGVTLAKTLGAALQRYQKRSGSNCPPAILMQNHGLVVCGDKPDEIQAGTEMVLSRIKERLAKAPTEAFGKVERLDAAAARQQIEIIAPALRGLLASTDTLKIVAFDDSDLVMSFVGTEEGCATALKGPLTPDQIVYCKSFPLSFEPDTNEKAVETVERLRSAIAAYEKERGCLPNVVLVKGLGLFAAGNDYAAAQTVRVIYADAIKIMCGAKRLGGVNQLSDPQRIFIEEWELEAFRLNCAVTKTGRVANKVAVITGAAQGFGRGIAEDFAANGGCVVIADMNVEGAQKAATELNARHGAGAALAAAVDVTKPESIAQMLHEVVRAYGGFDLFLANAGVVKAGSVKTLAEKDLVFSTSVNYHGYFFCVQKASAVLALQHRARPSYFSDIIQVNSKSGLVGSNKNGAYAGSKFGGVGLTQSFALELVEDNIKVNAVCPGNYFDGPAWMHPETGAFVQYLKMGKVPGAKTVEEVRKAYEDKIPMRRGCLPSDVAKGIFYLMEQKYETGQALPISGGQVMLN